MGKEKIRTKLFRGAYKLWDKSESKYYYDKTIFCDCGKKEFRIKCHPEYRPSIWGAHVLVVTVTCITCGREKEIIASSGDNEA